jgi:Type I restriction enzyme R protein N terminus (HSDR_N)
MNFEQFNETDVREEVIAPWLRTLGYRSATQHNILREQSLRYPRVFLGRKNSSKDPLLRGKADYILEAGRRVRWVIEAKAPSSELNLDEVEQAWTYASHPEVRAVYFCLCNGKQLLVYQTHGGPEVGPVMSLTYEQLEDQSEWAKLVSVLSPEAVLRDYPILQADVGTPLGPNLRSIARITGGHICYTSSSVANPAISQLQVSIVAGAIERDERGRMVALVQTRAPFRSIQALAEKLGLSQFEMVCDEPNLATSHESPSVFMFEGHAIFPAGEEMLDIVSWKSVILPVNLAVRVKVTAWGALSGNVFRGRIKNEAIYNETFPASFDGEFELHLA